ncbi:type III secretion system export apparatus subunit SctU [Endozoicomonas sp. SCSIO W0465]|uniref:type III secretion system export apparatus subunit SctU n=1 Tax=Endozoicomonas sp. SCSIO W0465 TaxID=2918516 RepID=UPI002076389C|nr:type III secretion system export apparatus subunit SctU [Endozoicomonas sp. SCSIO W0465]USE34668.1 type III secretion system export apparatus subunit SctU [Endozoicomonas sp. SCSIO W0465]
MSAEKTEQPTPKKLRDARQKGQVAKSKEVSGTFGLIAVLALIWVMSDDYISGIIEMVILPSTVYNEPFEESFKIVAHGILEKTMGLLLPLIAVSAVSAIIGNVMQFGMLFAPEGIKPDINKISPVGGLKKIFALKNLIEFFKSIIKIIFLSFVVYYVIYSSLGDMINIPYCGSDCILPVTSHLLKKLLLYAVVAFVIIAVLDYMFERYNFMKQNRMSKDEVKREHKESEGSPEIKGKRKEIHQEILNQAENTGKSDVVIKNPTHLAIGLQYRQGKTPLPMVTVKGRGGHARFIIKIAEKEGIPVLENVPLAHALFHLNIADFIPGELIEPVAEVFRWVQEIKEQEQDNGSPAEDPS